MDNDLGTPDALAVVFESINAGNALLDSQDFDGAKSSLATVTELLEVLGLSQIEKDSDDDVEELIRQREIARQEKNFKEADRKFYSLTRTKRLTLQIGRASCRERV